MKKNLLALSIAAMVGGIAGGANAQVMTDTTGGGRVLKNNVAAGKLAAPAAGVAANFLTPTSTGIGHILFVPYFTTQNGNGTLLNLVNHDQVNGKAVKLRFRGAANSDDLFDISIFLSPGDHWAANISADGELSALSTDDTTCTLPSIAQIKETKGKFSTNRVLNNAAAETREGYVEILNMADIVPGTELFKAVKHASVNGTWKAPCDQAVMDKQALPLSNDATSPNEPTARGYSWPTGGLSVNWSIVNTTTRASWTGEGVALRATPTRTIDQAGAANLVFSPQTAEIVADNAIAALTADPLLRLAPGADGRVRSANYDFPDLSTPYTGGVNGATPEAQANELASALETYSISNEFVTNAAVNFATDWVFAMPTRRYAVALNYVTKKPAYNMNYVGFPTGGNQYFSPANMSVNKDLRLCVDAGQLKAFDREEMSRTTFVISPDDVLRFCGEAAVLTFNDQPSVLGAKLTAQNIPTKFVDGWMQIQTPGTGSGLPVMGYATVKALDAAGGNYGGTWMHRTNSFKNQPF